METNSESGVGCVRRTSEQLRGVRVPQDASGGPGGEQSGVLVLSRLQELQEPAETTRSESAALSETDLSSSLNAAPVQVIRQLSGLVHAARLLVLKQLGVHAAAAIVRCSCTDRKDQKHLWKKCFIQAEVSVNATRMHRCTRSLMFLSHRRSAGAPPVRNPADPPEEPAGPRPPSWTDGLTPASDARSCGRKHGFKHLERADRFTTNRRRCRRVHRLSFRGFLRLFKIS